MIFRTSSEQDVLVGEAAQAARKKVKDVLAEILSEVSLECGAETWSFISILMRDEWIGDYPEVKRYHKSRKVIEVRVQIPIYEFKEAGSAQQVELMLDAVYRSVDMMAQIKSLKLSNGDAQVLRESVEKARVLLRAA
ncbi:hypothetical protein [Pseudomonas sp. NPDC089401]|uniref:hypothetical protein n=1 Tax=Pseudomonas sp. NPDC089401 TaxID=3364462 RepID=UPI00381F6B73